jgi:hypothetical protein
LVSFGSNDMMNHLIINAKVKMSTTECDRYTNKIFMNKKSNIFILKSPNRYKENSLAITSANMR